jgi:hypothetical protein
MDFWNAMTQTSYILPLWEFDHPSGHDSERKDGLTTSAQQLKMNWGKGRQMRDSVLMDGCVCTIQHKDQVFPGCTYVRGNVHHHGHYGLAALDCWSYSLTSLSQSPH